MRKRGQEEMVGFALIIIIVAVILLIFLGFSIRNSQRESVESYEIESFIQATLQYTTSCEDYFGYLSVQETIFDCSENQVCQNGKSSCDVLEDTLKGILAESWNVEGDRPVKGYELKITSNEQEILSLSEGNQTRNSKGAMQNLEKAGNEIEFYFTTYY